jgi:hypothetical protein
MVRKEIEKDPKRTKIKIPLENAPELGMLSNGFLPAGDANASVLHLQE